MPCSAYLPSLDDRRRRAAQHLAVGNERFLLATGRNEAAQRSVRARPDRVPNLLAEPSKPLPQLG